MISLSAEDTVCGMLAMVMIPDIALDEPISSMTTAVVMPVCPELALEGIGLGRGLLERVPHVERELVPHLGADNDHVRDAPVSGEDEVFADFVMAAGHERRGIVFGRVHRALRERRVELEGLAFMAFFSMIARSPEPAEYSPIPFGRMMKAPSTQATSSPVRAPAIKNDPAYEPCAVSV